MHVSLKISVEFLICCIILVLNKSCHGGKYSYEEKEKWSELYPNFCAGNMQSPIDLSHVPSMRSGKNKLDLTGYNILQPSLDIENNGHTIVVYPKYPITITGGPANKDTYQLVQFHFHWGENRYSGSEHMVDGRKYAMEIHFVHMNTRFLDINDALNDPRGILAIGIIVMSNRGTDDNEKIQYFSKNLYKIKMLNTRYTIYQRANLAHLLPKNRNNKFVYFTYNGSLTTPNCNEAVTWVVSQNALQVHDSEIGVFRQLLDDSGNRIVNNVRPVQPVNGRNIFLTKTKRH